MNDGFSWFVVPSGSGRKKTQRNALGFNSFQADPINAWRTVRHDEHREGRTSCVPSFVNRESRIHRFVAVRSFLRLDLQVLGPVPCEWLLLERWFRRRQLGRIRLPYHDDRHGPKFEGPRLARNR